MTPRWQPTPAQIEASTLTAFMRAHGHEDYESLRQWSVSDLPTFWTALWEWYDVQADGSPATVLGSEEMPGATWFPDVSLSYAEHVFRGKRDDDVALRHASELRPLETWTWGRLRAETARIRAGLQALGVGHGDRVAAYLPNIPEALAAMLATASLGAIWSSCSPDFGPSTVLDRFEQIEPAVLLAVDGYRYGGKDFDRRAVVAELSAGLPTVTRTVVLPYLGEEGDWDEVFGASTSSADGEEPLAFARVPFAHPLWILYSSGTSGKPKAIVHGHGGILLEHLKVAGLHVDARAGDRVFWFTTTGWMMWNFLVSMLLTPAEIVLYDGLPSESLWQLADEAGITIFGTSAAFIHAQMKSGVTPPSLPALRAVGSTGSPLSAAGFEWVWEHLGEQTWLFSISGGTDVCSAFVGGVPTLPVWVGEIQARSLGCAVEAWDEAGHPVLGEVGELVITRPMPSMPVGFWNDPDGRRYLEAYFDFYPAVDGHRVWRHGDWLEITPRGTCVIHGRSDATINRGGIRMGTAEIYAAVLAVEGVSDALVVDVPATDPAADSWMPLFVVTPEELSEDLIARIKSRIRTDCSPRHVPNLVVRVPAIPRTLTGKALEIPVKRLFLGADPASVATKDALANPEAFDYFVEYVAQHPAPQG